MILLLPFALAWPEAPNPDEPHVPVPEKEAWVVPPSLDNTGASEGALAGKAVYVSQCHGWIYSESLDRFALQRGNNHDSVEDFHNPEGANEFLIPLLENAGASVFTTRERDPSPLMAIADNDGEGYSETGSGFVDAALGFAETGPWDYGEDPFNSGSTRAFPANGDGVATWQPEVPEDGYYVVYVSWDSDSGNSPSALYQISHPGGTYERRFDQRVHGSTWQYVDRLWLTEGFSLTVELVADGGTGMLNADAVRIGGGQDDIRRHGDVTGRDRWESGAIQYVQYNGAPTSVYDPYGDGDGSDPSSRSRWADWEHPSGEDAVYLSWHSNAGGGTGTSTFTSSQSSSMYSASKALGGLVHGELVDAIRVLWDSDWTDRKLNEANFSEVNPSHNDEMPAVLVELAFHDHVQDIELLKDPRFRWDASRAMVRGIVQYFADQDGTTARFQPEPPRAFSALGGVLSWEAGPSGAPYGDAATGYRLYTSQDGRSWDTGVDVEGTSTTLDSDGFFRVTATNAGGESFPTQVLAMSRAVDVPILLVTDFDRMDVGLLRWEDVPSVGAIQRMDLQRVNPMDTLVAHAEALPWPFDSSTDEGLPDLDAYDVVIWAAGEESDLSDHHDVLADYIAGGGALWISGSEVVYGDESWTLATLGAALQSDDAGTTGATGTGLLEGIDLNFNGALGGYPVEYPDVLRSEHDELALYDDGSLAGILNGQVALFGFPFETIASLQSRQEVASRLLPELSDWSGSEDTEAPTDDTAPRVAATPGERHRIEGCGHAPGGAGLLLLLAALGRRRVSRTSRG